MKFTIRDLLLVTMIVSLTVVCGYSEVRSEEADSKSSPLSVSMVLSDVDILVGDPVLYKLLLRNRSRSLIHISKRPGRSFTHFLDYRRKPSEKWVQVAEISAATRGALEGERAIPGEQTFATYGKFFTNVEREMIFASPGDYDVRIRVKCLLGEFTTDAQTVHVGARPPAEVKVIGENANSIRSYIDFFRFTDPPAKHFAELRPGIHGGSLERTLQMFEGVGKFMETHEVDGKECSTAEAFRKLSKGLDEVRRDQLALTLLWNDMEARKWKDVEELLPELKEESEYQIAIRSELQSAVRRELLKKRVP